MPETLAQRVFQIGFVVPDIHKAMAFFKDKLGVPEFLYIEDPGLTDETYHGKPVKLDQHIAFCIAAMQRQAAELGLAGTATGA